MSRPSKSVKQELREYFLTRIGEVITSRDLAQLVAPRSEWARRVRELRDEEGWPIETHNDSAELKPGEYRLTSSPPAKNETSFNRGAISQRTRAEVLDRDGYTCQWCGLAAGDTDPLTGRRVQLQMGHIKDKALGGTDDISNLRTLCRTCNQGAKNITQEKPTTIWLLAQVRRGGVEEQKAVRDWLNNKYGKDS